MRGVIGARVAQSRTFGFAIRRSLNFDFFFSSKPTVHRYTKPAYIRALFVRTLVVLVKPGVALGGYTLTHLVIPRRVSESADRARDHHLKA